MSAELDRIWNELAPELDTGSAADHDDNAYAGYLLAWGALGLGVAAMPTGTSRADWIERARHAASFSSHDQLRLMAEVLAAESERDQGEIDRAITILSDAQEAFSAQIPGRPEFTLELCELLRKRKRFDEALSTIGPVLASYEPSEDRMWVYKGLLHGKRGQIYLDKGVPDLAAIDIEEERVIAVEHDSLQPTSLARRADLALATEDFANLERDLTAALAEEEALHPKDRALVAWRMGQAQAELDRMSSDRGDTATPTLLEVVDELPFIERAMAELLLGRVALRRGKLEEAERWLGFAGERLRADGRAEQDENLIAVERLVALEAGIALARTAPPAELELRRRDLEATLARVIAEWDGLVPTRGGVGRLHYRAQRELLAVLSAVHVALEPGPSGAEAALATLTHAQSRGSLVRIIAGDSRPLPAASLERVRSELLNEKGGWLVYLMAAEEGHLIAFDRDRIAHARLEPRFVIDRARRKLLDRLRRPPADPLDVAAHQAVISTGTDLAERLLPGEVRDLVAGWEELSVCGLETIGYLPFECLVLEGELLGMRTAIDYPGSLALGLRLHERLVEDAGEPFDHDLVLFTAPRPDALLAERYAAAPLSWNGERESPFIDAYPRGRALVHSADAFTIDLLQGLAKQRVRVAHLIAHGISDWTSERPNGLLLSPGTSDDGRLWAHAFDSWRSPPLVVVSSCGAAQAPLRVGDYAINHLGGAILAVGAHAVVLSTFEQQYGANLELSGHFHQRLGQGDSPARALQAARKAMARNPATAHPFYHSLMHVIGIGQAPELR